MTPATPTSPTNRTSRPILYIWIGTIAVLGAALAITLPAAARANRNASAAQVVLTKAAHDAGLVAALRVGVPESSAEDQGRGGLTPRVTSALERAGLPASSLASLSPEAESQLAGQTGLRVSRRRATLTLSGVTLPQVGRFLDAWRSTEPAWTPASIDLSPVGGKAPEAGGDLPLRAVIAIEITAVGHDGVQQ